MSTSAASAASPASATSPVSAAPAAASGATAAPAQLAAPMTPAQVLQFLDQTVDWYHTLGIQQQAANEPSDLLFLYDNRQTAGNVIALAFDIARADAELLGREPFAKQDGDDGVSASSPGLLQLRHKLDAQLASIQDELGADRRSLATASKKSKIEAQARINELQGELDLANTKRGILDTMSAFTTGTDASSAANLKAQIDAMAVSIPGAMATATTMPAVTAPPATVAPTSQPPLGSAGLPMAVGRFGLWDLASNAFRLSEKSGTLDSIDRRTTALQTALGQIRTPFVAQIKALSASGDALAAQADSADSTTLNGMHDRLDALAAQFKHSSTLLIPLSKETALLNQYRRTLKDWRDAIDAQYRQALKTLGIRLGGLLFVLALLFGAAELWRRTVLRFIQDSRRRYQLLLLRRIALWSVVVIVIGIAFASELSSFATFAGLITAGIAVAMQSVLVSIVGYFFLIGKYGIRIGDRVQIGEVAGEVIDLGLVRMYLMELGNKGATGPTGRVVAFANSVVFQVSSGLFKQIPGVNFSWREITLNLPAGIDFAAAKKKLLAAMIDALQDYHPEILRQTEEIQRTTLARSAGDAQPQVRLQFSATGVEAHVRYPVHLQNAAEIDERVTEALTKVVSEVTAAAG